VSPFSFGLALAAIYPIFTPLQGLWHKIIQGHLEFPLPTPGTLFFKTPLVLLLLLGCSMRFRNMGWLHQPLSHPLFAFLGFLGLFLYRIIPFPHVAGSFQEYQDYAFAVYATLSFSLWAFLASLDNPWTLLKRHWKLVSLALVITLGLGAIPKYLYENPSVPFFGDLIEQYRFLLLRGAHLILTPFFEGVQYSLAHNSLLVEDFGVRLAFECSGFQGIQLITLFSFCYLLFEGKSLKNSLSWFFLGLILILVANLFRVGLLTAIGAMGKRAWALNAFHSSAGTLIFTLIGSLMIWIAHRNSTTRKDAYLTREPYGQTLEKTDLYPFATFLFLTLIFRPFTPEHDWSYPLKVLILIPILIFCTRSKQTLQACSPGWLPLATGGIIAILWVLLQPEASLSTFEPESLSSIWIIFRLIGGIICIPIIEERFFRRYLLHLLTFRQARAVVATPYELIPCVISSLIFGLLHQNILGGICSGLLFCWIAQRRGRLSDAIWCHAISNGVLASLVIWKGQWELW
jgi:CAAX prenyl protease-like protein